MRPASLEHLVDALAEGLKPVTPLPTPFKRTLDVCSALLLQFFHPFAVTVVDIAVHVAAITLVVGIAAAFRPMLRPA